MGVQTTAARVVPIDPVAGSMLRHPAGKKRRRRGYPPTSAPKLRAVPDKR